MKYKLPPFGDQRLLMSWECSDVQKLNTHNEALMDRHSKCWDALYAIGFVGKSPNFSKELSCGAWIHVRDDGDDSSISIIRSVDGRQIVTEGKFASFEGAAFFAIAAVNMLEPFRTASLS